MVEENSDRAVLEVAGSMAFFLAWLAKQVSIVVAWALEPVWKIRISMSVVGCRGSYGRRG
jgi:hypothetical protein